MRVLLEVKFFTGAAGSVVLSARCKASSCRVRAAFNGDLEAVLTSLTEHLRSHGEDMANTMRWIRGETSGVRSIR